MSRLLTKPLTRPADGWRLATCEVCARAGYIDPRQVSEGIDECSAWCQACRKETPHTLVSNPSPPAIL